MGEISIQIRFFGFVFVLYFDKKWREVYTSAYGCFIDKKTLSIWAGPFGAYIERCSH